MALSVGDLAPDFTAETHEGRTIRLSDFRGRQAVVIFFYPMNGTLVCTAEACSFRDAFADFTSSGAAVIGISGDSLVSHRNFAASQKLPYFLVSDANQSLRKAFQVPNTLGLIPQRVTYVIDQQGVVRLAFSALFSAAKHIEKALAVVKQLTKQGSGGAGEQG